MAGCGGGHPDRTAVNDFIGQANEIQGRATPQFRAANEAYLRFSQGKLPSRRAPRDLARAERAMRLTRDQIAALHAPEQAQTLKQRLVALYDADSAFAHESTELARYMPAAARATSPLGAANRTLARSLKHGAPAAEAIALEHYARSVGSVSAHLRRLRPPPILNMQYGRQLSRFQHAAGLARRLAAAVRRRDSQAVANLLLRFRTLSAGAGIGLTRGAVAAYNRRYASVRAAFAAVQRERARLDRALK